MTNMILIACIVTTNWVTLGNSVPDEGTPGSVSVGHIARDATISDTVTYEAVEGEDSVVVPFSALWTVSFHPLRLTATREVGRICMRERHIIKNGKRKVMRSWVRFFRGKYMEEYDQWTEPSPIEPTESTERTP